MQSNNPPRRLNRARAGVLSLLALLVLWACTAAPAATTASSRRSVPPGIVEFDARSDFSHLRVRRQGSVLTLSFVRDSGEEAIETSMNVRKPYDLLELYAHYMFASYFFQPQPTRVLIIGLGGGAMVQFLAHYDPAVHVDAVEIDPLVVEVADRYFATRPGKNINIITADGLRFLEETPNRYDVIYMDAFLKPSAETDATGAPLRLKTVEFYKGVQKKLARQGVVSLNLNASAALDDDLRTLRSAFAQVYVFRAGEGNVVAIASPAERREELSALHQQAKQIDQRFKASYSFQGLLKHLAP